MSEVKSCCTPSCENPNSTEYGKCWKEQHNAGCGCSCTDIEDGCSSEDTTARVVRSRLTRSDFLS